MQWLNKYLSTTIEIKKYGVGNHGLETNNVQPLVFKNLRNSFIFTNDCQPECFFVGYRMWAQRKELGSFA